MFTAPFSTGLFLLEYLKVF